MISLSREFISDAIIKDDPGPRAAFLSKHRSRVDRIIDQLTVFYNALDPTTSSWPRAERAATTTQFLHAAGNSLLTSTNLLVAGFPLAAGNLMRQHTEAVAMTMLCATPKVNVLEMWRADRRHYPIHKAVTIIQRKDNAQALRDYLGFDVKAWKGYIAGLGAYEHFSHSGVLALGFHVKLNSTGGMILGAAYDGTKFAVYRRELQNRVVAGKHLVRLLHGIDAAVKQGSLSSEGK